METLSAIPTPPLPDATTVMANATLLKQYYQLYMNYAFATPLPQDFPRAILHQFPNKSYKQLLKNAIASLTIILNGELAIQTEYLKDYYILYSHYSNGVTLPSNFPTTILDLFPSPNYKQQLKIAIINLQKDVDTERALS